MINTEFLFYILHLITYRMRSQNKKFSSFVHNYISGSTDSDNKHISNKTDFQRWISRFGLSPRFKPFLSWSKRLEERVLLNWDCLGLSFRGIYIYLVTIIIIIIITIITVFTGVLFVHQPGANHAPRASVTQVNHSVLLLLLLLLL